MQDILGFYQNGNYNVTIYRDGTKVRETIDPNATEWLPNFSENCDVKFTHKCSQGCKFCYEGCNKNGNHSDIMNQNWIHSVHPYTELAINGNDMDHPDIEKFLEFMYNKKVVVNITVNQNQFVQNFSKLCDLENKHYIHGVGVSISSFNDEIKKLVSMFPQKENIVFHTINGILTKDEIDKMKNMNYKVLILGYKDVRRGHEYKESSGSLIKQNQEYLYNHLKDMLGEFKVVSFDNLAIEQLNVKRLLNKREWDEFYMGDDGQFTFYIDAVARTFAKNSVISEKENFPIGGMSIDEMFDFIKKKYGKNI